MKLSKKQTYVLKHYSKYRPTHVICEGAVRSGKTFINNVIFFLHHIQTYRNKDFIVTGHTITSIERNIFKPLYDDFGLNIYLSQKNRFEFSGNMVHCFGTDKSDSYKHMTGMTSYGWYGNEVTLSHPNSINEAFNRTSGTGFLILWDTNPDYPDHPIKVNYINRTGEKLENGRIRIKSHHFQLDDNIFLDKTYIENLKKATPAGMWYNRRIKGLWVAAEGVIYENFYKEIHTIEPMRISDDWRRIRSIDFGFKNPFACLWGAIDNDGRIYIYHEYKKSETLIKDHAYYIKNFIELNKDKKPINYDVTVADHDAQERAEYEALDVYTRAANKDVNVGLQKVSERLIVQPDGKPRLMIFNNCKELVKELQAYVWEPKKEGKPYKEQPLKVNDHLCDCLRMLVMEVDGKRIIKASGWSAGELGL